MTVSRWLRHAAAVGALAACPISAHAQLHTDGTMSGWTSSLVINPYGCASGTGATSATGGNPGSYWAVTHYDCGSLVGVAHLSTFSWNPGTQGAVLGPVKVTWDGIHFTGGDMAFEAALYQGGKWYMAPTSYGLASFGNGWTSLGGAILGADWCELPSNFGPPNGYLCGGGLPDFTASGGALQFGVMALNSGSYGQNGGIDNFAVDFQHGPGQTVAPEPASLALLATGVLGLGFVTRRRRTS